VHPDGKWQSSGFHDILVIVNREILTVFIGNTWKHKDMYKIFLEMSQTATRDLQSNLQNFVEINLVRFIVK